MFHARRAGFALVAVSTLLTPRAFATCTANLILQQVGTGTVSVTETGKGNCTVNGLNGGAVQLYEGSTLIANCPDGNCSFSYTYGASCGNTQTRDLTVTCVRNNAAGNGCENDDPGYATQTIYMSHAGLLSIKSMHDYQSGSVTAVSGTAHAHAPDAWGNRTLQSTLLYADGTSQAVDTTAIGADAYDNVDVSFSAIPTKNLGTLVLTLTSCGDPQSSMAVDIGGTHECKCGPDTPAPCPDCAGGPVRFSDGGMQLSDPDPLPTIRGVPFTRTYNTKGVATEWFGAHWSSIFDRVMRTYANVPDGPWAIIWIGGSKRYVFHQKNSAWEQVWPAGTITASLTTDSTTGNDVLREPNSDLEIVIEPASGLPVAYRSRATGRSLDITYSGTTPAHVADSWNAIGWTVTTSGNRITAVSIDNTSMTWQYNYTGNDLTSVIGPGGAIWRTYIYTNGVLTESRDAAGRTIESHAYDSQGRATTSIQAEDDIQSVNYAAGSRNNGNERAVSVQYASGAVTTYWLAYVAGRVRTVEIQGNCTSCGVNNAVYAFDPGDDQQQGGQLRRMQDARGYITQWTYETAGRVLTESRGYKPSGCDPETDAARCHQTPAGLLTVALDATNATETTTYAYTDSSWREKPTSISRASIANAGQATTTDLTYDSMTGDVLSETVHGWSGNNAETHTTTTSLYDGTEGAAFDPGDTFATTWLTLPQPAGLRKSIDGPRTDVNDLSQWVYYPTDASVPATLRGRLAATRNAEGQITRFESYDINGNPTRIVDANSVATESTYDAIGRALTTTLKAVSGCDTSVDPLCATDLTTTNAFQNTFGPLGSTTAPGSGVTTYDYDSRGRQTSVTRSISSSASERIEYDYSTTNGRKIAERYLRGQPGAWTLARSEAYRYDIYGRLTAVDHPDSTSILYTYDPANHVASVQDENHTTPNTTYQYDAAGRLTRVTQTLSTAAAGTIATQYGYDAHDNLTSVTDPNGNFTTYAFDDFGRMLQQVSPVTGTTTYSYDAAGNLLSTSDANGATSTRTYDALNRVTTATTTRSGETESVSWAYDGTSGNRQGRLATMTDPTGTTSYTYERRGLLAGEQKTVQGAAYVSAYQYDRDGNRSQISYPSGRVMTFAYDLAGRPVSATANATTLVINTTYAPFGPATSITYGNGTTRTVTLNTRYQIRENRLASSAGTIADYTYAEDAAGNIRQIHDATDATFNRDFGYDDLNRLTTATSGASLWGNGAYQYDAMGNLMSQTIGSWRSGSFTYQGTTPKIATATENGSSRPVTYDPAGNETEVGAATYSYTPRNELGNADGITYSYDGRGVRTITSFADPGTSIASLTFAPATLTAGESTVATITLTAPAPANGATIRLSTANPAVVPTPATVTIPAGATTGTATITTSSPSSNTSVAVGASYFDSSQSGTLTVLTPPVVTALDVSPTSVIGGATATGTVTLDNPAPAAGSVVTLSSSDPSIAPVPSSATVPAGQTSATFSITTSAASAATSVTITATFGNTRTASLGIRTSDASLASLTLSPLVIYGGKTSSTGTVSLTAPAPSGGASITLSSSNPVVTVPATVTVPAGATNATFTASSNSVTVSTSSTITASYDVTRTADLIVYPCSGFPAPPPTLGNDESVWFDDALPNAAIDHPWVWSTAYFASGTKSHEEPAATGAHGHYFYYASTGMTAAAHELITTWVLLDPCNPPREIELNWENNRGSWEYRAYWGENLISGGTTDTPSRRYIGPLPPAGVWTRLDVPASSVSLTGANITGENFILYDGHAWFDRAAKASCSFSTAAAPSSLPSTDRIWFDDTLPAGAVTTNWNWDTTQRASGSQSHTNPLGTDPYIQHYFTDATATMTAGTGETFFAYVLLDPCTTPGEIMLQFYANGSWEHRAFWGGDEIAAASKTRIGDRPPSGQWVRLEVPASAVGLENVPVTGMAFTSTYGTVWWDRVGVAPVTTGSLLLNDNPSMASSMESPAPAPRPKLSIGQRLRRWVDTHILHRRRPPASLSIGALLLADTVTTKQRYSLYTPELSLMSETATSTATNPPIAYDYVWFNGEPLAQIENATGTIHWYFDDHLGTPILTTDSTGAVDWRVEREPYGTAYVRAGGSRHQPLGLPGQENDESGERQYNIFRWYRSSWGRYTQFDPAFISTISQSGYIADDGHTLLRSTHPYAYGDDNPVGLRDPLGLQAAAVAAPFGIAGPAAAAAGGAALASCLANPLCRREIRCFAEFARDVARCTARGLCTAASGDPLHNDRVESCLIRSSINLRQCRRGWPRKYPDPWPGPTYRGPGSPAGPPEPPEPTAAEPPAAAASGW